MNLDVTERERICGALRGRRIPTLAIELGVPVPTIEAFVSGANLAPDLLVSLARILARSPAPNIPAAVSTRNNCMRLNARALKVTLVLDAAELAALPDPATARIVLQIAVAGGRTVTADVAAKSLRKCKATIAEHGADQVALIIQGKLTDGNVVAEAGLVAQVKTPRPPATMSNAPAR